MPHGNARQIEVERDIAHVTTSNGTASVQKEVFWGKDLLFLEAKAPGARMDIPFSIDAAGRYELVAQVGAAPDYGIYQVLVDGKPVSASPGIETEPGANIGAGAVIDGYYREVFVGEDRLITWAQLAAGAHTVSFVCMGKNAQSSGYSLGVDGLVIARVADGSGNTLTHDSASSTNPADRLRRIGALGPAAASQMAALKSALTSSSADEREAALWAFTQLRAAAAPAIPALTLALRDESHVARGLAALALRDAGPLPDASVDALMRVVDTDGDDDGVRMMAANAIAAQGARVARVVPALIAVGGRAGVHRHILRAVADALGAAGPAARDALPMLREMAKQPLVRWNANAAMRRIDSR